MTTTLRVEEMSCQNCVRHVREAIQKLHGIGLVTVDLEKAEAVVQWKGDNISESELIKCLNAAGYPSRVIKTTA